MEFKREELGELEEENRGEDRRNLRKELRKIRRRIKSQLKNCLLLTVSFLQWINIKAIKRNQTFQRFDNKLTTTNDLFSTSCPPLPCVLIRNLFPSSPSPIRSRNLHLLETRQLINPRSRSFVLSFSILPFSHARTKHGRGGGAGERCALPPPWRKICSRLRRETRFHNDGED